MLVEIVLVDVDVLTVDCVPYLLTPVLGGFAPGDVLGFLLHLPRKPDSKLLVDKADATRVVVYKGRPYIEEVFKADRNQV